MTKQEHARQFIEWVELNRILGAGHFIVYNHSVGKELNYVLQMYEETGLVEVVQWDVPFLEHEIQYYGQNAALNDCLLRSRLKSRYLVNEDMDEFIIPQEKHVYTWNQLLELYPKHSSYSFISSFYPVEYHSHINQTNENVFTQLVTLTSAQRGTKFHEDKTKYIARTDTVLIIVVHYAMVFKWGGQTNIPPAIGFLHHYRREVEYTTVRDKYGGEFVEDTTVRDKYGGEFVEDTTVRDKYGGEFVEDTTVRDKYGRELTNNTKEPLKSLKKFVSSLN